MRQFRPCPLPETILASESPSSEPAPYSGGRAALALGFGLTEAAVANVDLRGRGSHKARPAVEAGRDTQPLGLRGLLWISPQRQSGVSASFLSDILSRDMARTASPRVAYGLAC